MKRQPCCVASYAEGYKDGVCERDLGVNTWINTKDRSPDDGILVLGFAGGSRYGSFVLCEIKINEDKEKIWNIYGIEEHSAGYGGVEYWMPIPELPK